MYAKYTITDFDNLEPHHLQRIWDECNAVEAKQPDLNGLTMRQLEALVWYYRALQSNWVYEGGPQSPDENLEYHRERARCAEIQFHVFKRQYDNEQGKLETVLAERDKRRASRY